ASLLALRMSDFHGHVVPDEIDARETYYIQARLDKLKRRTVYIRDCIIHRSKYRGRKMEWEGANTRIAAGLSLRELAFCFRVMVLMSLNSHSVKNLAYVPIAYLHFCRGFVQPSRWNRLQRVEE
ncbi:MAG TPA: hypothetical protein VEB67_03800, partial [Nitrososphaerales archaeon]|nr:hypothetical protein [Nitrososphaerales archaeon]